MAIGLLATITVREGMNEEFENAFLDLAEQVRANEPGNHFYALHRSGNDSHMYKVMEQYASQEALDAHSQSDLCQSSGAATDVLRYTRGLIQMQSTGDSPWPLVCWQQLPSVRV